jgi:hypothetical protein
VVDPKHQAQAVQGQGPGVLVSTTNTRPRHCGTLSGVLSDAWLNSSSRARRAWSRPLSRRGSCLAALLLPHSQGMKPKTTSNMLCSSKWNRCVAAAAWPFTPQLQQRGCNGQGKTDSCKLLFAERLRTFDCKSSSGFVGGIEQCWLLMPLASNQAAPKANTPWPDGAPGVLVSWRIYVLEAWSLGKQATHTLPNQACPQTK